jgi:hypothetical protein
MEFVRRMEGIEIWNTSYFLDICRLNAFVDFLVALKKSPNTIQNKMLDIGIFIHYFKKVPPVNVEKKYDIEIAFE